MDAIGTSEVVVRVLVAGACGMAVGLERELRGQPAGLRTHVVLAVGAALAMLLGIQAAQDADISDPQRIPAQVISGIGFLGAGAILRYGMNVHGLTTATSLWTVSVIGLVCGYGEFFIGVFATGLLITVLMAARRFEFRAFGYREVKRVKISATDGDTIAREIIAAFDERNLFIDHLGLERDFVSKELRMTGYIRCGQLPQIDDLIRTLQQIDGVKSCRIG